MDLKLFIFGEFIVWHCSRDQNQNPDENTLAAFVIHQNSPRVGRGISVMNDFGAQGGNKLLY